MEQDAYHKSMAGVQREPVGAHCVMPLAAVEQGDFWLTYLYRVSAHVGQRFLYKSGRVEQTGGYCWPTSFKVLEVLFLGEVSSAFLPSKKACWAHQFRYLGVGQQYPGVFWWLCGSGSPSERGIDLMYNQASQ